MNTSQDPDYVGPTGHEKKFHKTHFGVVRKVGKQKPIDQDPNWVRIGPGRYRWVGNPKETLTGAARRR